MRIGIAKQIGAQPADKIGIPVPVNIKQSAAIAPVDMGGIHPLNQGGRPLAVGESPIGNVVMSVTV